MCVYIRKCYKNVSMGTLYFDTPLSTYFTAVNDMIYQCNCYEAAPTERGLFPNK